VLRALLNLEHAYMDLIRAIGGCIEANMTKIEFSPEIQMSLANNQLRLLLMYEVASRPLLREIAF
jgi:hypothetical protein